MARCARLCGPRWLSECVNRYFILASQNSTKYTVFYSVSTAPESASSVPTTDPDRWFVEKVHAHDAQLKAYLRGSFPSVRDVDDVAQESYLRLWRLRTTQPVRSAKALLFTIARRLAIDFVRRDRTYARDDKERVEDLSALAEDRSTEQSGGLDEKVDFFAEAIAELPTRCREVFVLHKIHGLSRRETASRLGISERTVGAHTSAAMKRCAKYLRRRGVKGLFTDDPH